MHEEAVGDCVMCGKDAAGSKYWTALPDDIWVAIWPAVASMFKDEDRVQNVLFFPAFSKPFCTAKCGMGWHEEYYGYGQEEI